MYTRCPQCRTTFALTHEQLNARGGVVKCGKCHQVFRGDQYLTKSLPQPQSGVRHNSVKTSTDTSGKPAKAEIGNNGQGTESPLPTLEELIFGKKRSHISPLIWILGLVLVTTALAGQFVYFYSTELSRIPAARIHVAKACEYLGCFIRPQIDAGLIEITKTRISPHSRYHNVLRLRASLINRAHFSQAYPLIEVSLSNRRGKVVGRRTFLPENYLKKQKDPGKNMIPNVIVHARLEFTRPSRTADGYEIRLLADPRVLTP